MSNNTQRTRIVLTKDGRQRIIIARSNGLDYTPWRYHVYERKTNKLVCTYVTSQHNSTVWTTVWDPSGKRIFEVKNGVTYNVGDEPDPGSKEHQDWMPPIAFYYSVLEDFPPQEFYTTTGRPRRANLRLTTGGYLTSDMEDTMWNLGPGLPASAAEKAGPLLGPEGEGVALVGKGLNALHDSVKSKSRKIMKVKRLRVLKPAGTTGKLDGTKEEMAKAPSNQG